MSVPLFPMGLDPVPLYARCGDHLLQVRTRVLNDQFAGNFYRRYPGLSRAPDPVAPAAWPPPECSALHRLDRRPAVQTDYNH